jgi:hypothetical protein
MKNMLDGLLRYGQFFPLDLTKAFVDLQNEEHTRIFMTEFKCVWEERKRLNHGKNIPYYEAVSIYVAIICKYSMMYDAEVTYRDPRVGRVWEPVNGVRHAMKKFEEKIKPYYKGSYDKFSELVIKYLELQPPSSQQSIYSRYRNTYAEDEKEYNDYSREFFYLIEKLKEVQDFVKLLRMLPREGCYDLQDDGTYTHKERQRKSLEIALSHYVSMQILEQMVQETSRLVKELMGPLELNISRQERMSKGVGSESESAAIATVLLEKYRIAKVIFDICLKQTADILEEQKSYQLTHEKLYIKYFYKYAQRKDIAHIPQLIDNTVVQWNGLKVFDKYRFRRELKESKKILFRQFYDYYKKPIKKPDILEGIHTIPVGTVVDAGVFEKLLYADRGSIELNTMMTGTHARTASNFDGDIMVTGKDIEKLLFAAARLIEGFAGISDLDEMYQKQNSEYNQEAIINGVLSFYIITEYIRLIREEPRVNRVVAKQDWMDPDVMKTFYNPAGYEDITEEEQERFSNCLALHKCKIIIIETLQDLWKTKNANQVLMTAYVSKNYNEIISRVLERFSVDGKIRITSARSVKEIILEIYTEYAAGKMLKSSPARETLEDLQQVKKEGWFNYISSLGKSIYSGVSSILSMNNKTTNSQKDTGTKDHKDNNDKENNFGEDGNNIQFSNNNQNSEAENNTALKPMGKEATSNGQENNFQEELHNNQNSEAENNTALKPMGKEATSNGQENSFQEELHNNQNSEAENNTALKPTDQEEDNNIINNLRQAAQDLLQKGKEHIIEALMKQEASNSIGTNSYTKNELENLQDDVEDASKNNSQVKDDTQIPSKPPVTPNIVSKECLNQNIISRLTPS